MARGQPIKVLRTTRAALNSQASAAGLLVGEPYLITDEGRLAIGLSTTTYGDVVLPADITTAGIAPYLTAYKEKVYTITDGAAFEINPANGTIQTITLGASRSPAATNFAAGQSVTLMVNDGTAYTITWPSVTWVGGSAPTLATSGYTVINLWKVGSTLYGMSSGSVA